MDARDDIVSNHAHRYRWTDDRLDDFTRLVGPAVGMVAALTADHDTLKEALCRHEKTVHEGFATVVAKVDGVAAAVEITNGRVNALEDKRAYDAGVRDATAAALEAAQKSLAVRLAARAWFKPVVGGGVVALLVTIAGRLLGVA